MPKLPLNVQVGIRDSWDKKDSAVQEAIEALREITGISVMTEPEWQLLLAELDSLYPDKSTFVPAIAGCVQAWCNALTRLLNMDENEDWSDDVLEHVGNHLRVHLEVSKDKEPQTSWSDEKQLFIISLPKVHMPSSMGLEELFKGQLLSCFDETPTPASTLSEPPAAADGWADVSMDVVTGRPALAETPQARPAYTKPEIERLPDCNILVRPDELLLKPPYHLVVYSQGTYQVEVQSSHSPSLQLLSEYLKRWCRVNNQQSARPPGVEVKLHQASFGLGLVYDRLTMQADGKYSPFTVTPMIVLAFVEGVLGYNSVHVDGSSWTFRKDVEFRK